MDFGLLTLRQTIFHQWTLTIWYRTYIIFVNLNNRIALNSLA